MFRSSYRGQLYSDNDYFTKAQIEGRWPSRLLPTSNPMYTFLINRFIELAKYINSLSSPTKTAGGQVQLAQPPRRRDLRPPRGGLGPPSHPPARRLRPDCLRPAWGGADAAGQHGGERAAVGGHPAPTTRPRRSVAHLGIQLRGGLAGRRVLPRLPIGSTWRGAAGGCGPCEAVWAGGRL